MTSMKTAQRNSTISLIVFGFLICSGGIAASTAYGKSLDFHIKNDTFARNIEHTKIDAINEGQTFIGNILAPYLSYRVKSGMTIEAGALLNIPFGEDDRVDTVDPIIALHYEFMPGMKITAGTLDRNHPLLDAIFNNDILQYSDPIEQGFQFQIQKKHWRTDTWIDWRERELPTRREKFNVGNYTQFRLMGFMAESQLYWNHLGGQSNSGGGADNNLAYSIGGGYSFAPKDMNESLNFFDTLGFSVHYVKVKDEPSGELPVSKEGGVLTRFFARVWDVDLHFLFWEGGGPQFLTDRGDPLYKADDYQEFGVQKTFWLADDVGLTAGFKGQYVEGNFVHENLVSVKWHVDFPILPDYVRNLSKTLPYRDRPAARN